MDECKNTALKAVFWDMIDISSNNSNDTITAARKSPYDIAITYGFDSKQNEILDELLFKR